MELKKTLVSGVFFLMTIVILFLGFQVTEMNTRARRIGARAQTELTLAARLVVQSATQTHPLLSYQHAYEAKFILDRLMTTYDGPARLAKAVHLTEKQVHVLVAQVAEQNETVQSFIMEKIFEVSPELNVDINFTAGLLARRKNTPTPVDRLPPEE
jgi:hypothetical protein